MGKIHIDVDSEGLPVFHDMPEEEFDNSLPKNAGPKLVKRALRHPRNHPLMGGPITILKGVEANTHVAWKKALYQLEELCASNTTATASDVSTILFEARGSYLADYDELTYFLDTAKKDYRHVLAQDHPARLWLAQCMARMFGVDAPSDLDENWWATARERVELGDDERFFSLTDLTWRRLLETNRHFKRGGFHEKVKIGAKKIIELVDEFFRREKNMPICELMEAGWLVCEPLNGPSSPSTGGR